MLADEIFARTSRRTNKHKNTNIEFLDLSISLLNNKEKIRKLAYF